MDAPQLSPPLAPRAPAALPWEWFDFREPARAPNSHLSDVVDEGGADRVWRVIVDSRIVPFKLLRRDPGAKPRPLLILLHGMGLTIATFHGVAPWLLQTHDLALVDYSSLSLALPPVPDGWPHGGLGIKVMAETIWAIANVLETPQFSLAGNSLGGALCLIAALQKPERVQRLLLSNPACYPQHLPRMYRIARVPILGELLMTITRPEKLIGGIEHIGYVDKSRFEPQLRHRYFQTLSTRRNRFRLMDMIRHLPHGPRDMTVTLHVPRLSELAQPVMLSWGEQDPLLAPGAGDRLANDLPNCLYHPYPQLAHMPHEEAPELIGPEWVAFLNSNDE